MVLSFIIRMLTARLIPWARICEREVILLQGICSRKFRQKIALSAGGLRIDLVRWSHFVLY